MGTHRGVVKGIVLLRGTFRRFFFSSERKESQPFVKKAILFEMLVAKALKANYLFEGGVAFNDHDRVLLVCGRLVSDYYSVLDDPRLQSWEMQFRFCHAGGITCRIQIGGSSLKTVPVCISSLPVNLRPVVSGILPILYHENL